MNPTSGRSSLGRDVGIVVALTFVTLLLAAHFELSEALHSFTRRWERIQLDEWPIALLALSSGLVWLSLRRHRQARTQLQAREAAEARLTGALAANRELAQQHLQLQETERKSLARELHDELGQYLNAITLDGTMIASGTCPDGATSRPAAQRIVVAADHVHGVVSELIRRLRPTGLDELGLGAAVESCIEHWRRRMPDVNFSVFMEGALDQLGEDLDLTLYRVIQEALTNSARHAAPKRIDIVLRREPAVARDRVVLLVSDDGRGMDTQRSRTGFGLRGMQERVEMLGGEFAIDTAPGGGFSIEAILPVAAGA